jgi:hypothetical protein
MGFNMKKSAVTLALAAAVALSTSAFAAEPVAPQPNPSGKEPNENASPVGTASSAVTRNGVVVREQAKSGMRSEEVQSLKKPKK